MREADGRYMRTFDSDWVQREADSMVSATVNAWGYVIAPDGHVCFTKGDRGEVAYRLMQEVDARQDPTRYSYTDDEYDTLNDAYISALRGRYAIEDTVKEGGLLVVISGAVEVELYLLPEKEAEDD